MPARRTSKTVLVLKRRVEGKVIARRKKKGQECKRRRWSKESTEGRAVRKSAPEQAQGQREKVAGDPCQEKGHFLIGQDEGKRSPEVLQPAAERHLNYMGSRFRGTRLKRGGKASKP